VKTYPEYGVTIPQDRVMDEKKATVEKPIAQALSHCFLAATR
jgi:hypothetical protein